MAGQAVCNTVRCIPASEYRDDDRSLLTRDPLGERAGNIERHRLWHNRQLCGPPVRVPALSNRRTWGA